MQLKLHLLDEMKTAITASPIVFTMAPECCCAVNSRRAKCSLTKA
jgi:hypothetical protein